MDDNSLLANSSEVRAVFFRDFVAKSRLLKVLAVSDEPVPWELADSRLHERFSFAGCRPNRGHRPAS